MTLDELIQTFIESPQSDWSEKLGTPTFLFAPADAPDLGHYNRMVYRPDVAVGLAWGSEMNDNYVWEWVQKFPDPKAHSILIDLLYNGQVVYRELGVVVDGGRATLPSPLPITKEDEVVPSEILGWFCKPHEYAFVRAFAEKTDDLRNFDSYFERSGIEVRD